jgi:MFS family permease
MHNLGAGWLMTSLTTAPWLVAMVQACISLPVFLIVLPAGALADMFDRRRLLLVAQSWMAVTALALAALTFSGLVTPVALLLLTFLLGVGAVLNDPAWQAITTEILPPEHLEGGIALKSAGFNLARAAGPAVGGLLITSIGVAPVFLINAISFIGVIFFLANWKNVAHQKAVAAPMRHNISEGVRYVRESKPVRTVLVRTGLFSFFASAIWALLPLVARPYGSRGFGFLLGCFGLGALVAAGFLPALRRRYSLDATVAVATVAFAASIVAVGINCGSIYCDLRMLCAILFCGGAAWIVILAGLNMCAQTMSPAWVRARSLSFYVLVLQGGLSIGSAIWGAVASNFGMMTALVAAASGLVIGLAASSGIHRLQPNMAAATAGQNP